LSFRWRGMDLVESGKWHRKMSSSTHRRRAKGKSWRRSSRAPTTRRIGMVMNHVDGDTLSRHSRSLAMVAPSASVLV
jgi:hypothetical protein